VSCKDKTNGECRAPYQRDLCPVYVNGRCCEDGESNMTCKHELNGFCTLPPSHGAKTCPAGNGDTCCAVCEGRGYCQDVCTENKEVTNDE
jgi:hypothetical protein